MKRVILEVDLAAVQNNYNYLQTIASSSILIPVVKCDAYGLGAIPITNALVKKGCTKVFCSTLEESLELREKTSIKDIYLLSGLAGLTKREISLFSKLQVVPALSSLDDVFLWTARKQHLPVILQFDVGMNRLGLSLGDINLLAKRGISEDSLKIDFIMGHLSNSFCHSSLNLEQKERFQKILGFFPKCRASLAATYGILLSKDYHYDFVRPGIGLSGMVLPEVLARYCGFSSALKIKTRLLHIRYLKAGEYVGYGATFQATEDKRIGIVSVGYLDGVSCLASNKAEFYLDEYRLPVVGVVSMDLIALDLSQVPATSCSLGSMVDIVRDYQSGLRLSQIMKLSLYELLTNFGNRNTVERTYFDSTEGI